MESGAALRLWEKMPNPSSWRRGPGTGLWLLRPSHPGSTCFGWCLVYGQRSTTPRQYPRNEGNSGARGVTWGRRGEKSQVSGPGTHSRRTSISPAISQSIDMGAVQVFKPLHCRNGKENPDRAAGQHKRPTQGGGGKEGSSCMPRLID